MYLFFLHLIGAKFVFDIYDLDGKDRMDSFYLGDALRSLDFIPTLALIEKLGGTTKRFEKYITIEEFLPIIHDVNHMKDMGNYDIFVECLRLHDHYETGSINLSDLRNALLNYGMFYCSELAHENVFDYIQT